MNLDFAFTLIVQEHSIIFVIAVLTLALSILLIRVKLLIFEVIIFVAMYAIEESMENMVYLVLMILQAVLGLYIVYRYIKAFDYNYHLVLEKTHQIPQNYTKHGADGTMRPF